MQPKYIKSTLLVHLIHTPVVVLPQQMALQQSTEPQIAAIPAINAVTAISAHIFPIYIPHMHNNTGNRDIQQHLSLPTTNSVTLEIRQLTWMDDLLCMPINNNKTVGLTGKKCSSQQTAFVCKKRQKAPNILHTNTKLNRNCHPK